MSFLFTLVQILLLSYLESGSSSEEFQIEAEPEITCRERNRLIGTDRNDLYELVTAALNETIQLQCHFCHEIDDMYPKIWYYQDQITSNTSHEVNLDLETNPILNHYFVTSSHTLIIRNVTIDDGGFYYCHGRTGQEIQYKYNYLVDVMYENNITSYIGNLTSWAIYQKEILAPMNTRFKLSIESDLALIRENFGVTLEIITDWGAWGKCQACGHPVGQAVKTRTGFCRIRTKQHFQEKIENDTVAAYTGMESSQAHFIINSFKLSCRSVFFKKLFPNIGNYTGNIPDYIQTDACVGSCISEAGQKGWKSKKSRFKYKKSYVIAESAHLTLVCPESTMESEVVWKKDNKELEGGAAHNFAEDKQEPHVAVDTFSTLYILDATPNEEGNYTCLVDDFKMQEVTVIVVAKSVLLTKAFLRHMAYLAFVLSLTLTCYCAGLFVMWKRRKSFKQFESLIEEDVSEESEIYTESDEPGTPASQIELSNLLTPIGDNQSKSKTKNKLGKDKYEKKSDTHAKHGYTNLSENGTSSKAGPQITSDYSQIESSNESNESIVYETSNQNVQYNIINENGHFMSKNELSHSTDSFESSKQIINYDKSEEKKVLTDETDLSDSDESVIFEPFKQQPQKRQIDESELFEPILYQPSDQKIEHELHKSDENKLINGSKDTTIIPKPSSTLVTTLFEKVKKPLNENGTKHSPEYNDSTISQTTSQNSGSYVTVNSNSVITLDQKYPSNETKENIYKNTEVINHKSNSLNSSSIQYYDEPEYAMRILLYQYDKQRGIDDFSQNSDNYNYFKTKSESFSSTSGGTFIQPPAANAHESSSSILQQVYTYDTDLTKNKNKIGNSEGPSVPFSYYLNNSTINSNVEQTLPTTNTNSGSETDETCTSSKSQFLIDFEENKKKYKSGILTNLKNYFMTKKSKACNGVDDANSSGKLLQDNSDNESGDGSSDETTVYVCRAEYDDRNETDTETVT